LRARVSVDGSTLCSGATAAGFRVVGKVYANGKSAVINCELPVISLKYDRIAAVSLPWLNGSACEPPAMEVFGLT